MKNQGNIVLGIFFCLLSVTILAGGSNVWAQKSFPTKPVRMIVHTSAGSGTDMEVRAIVPYVQKHLGVPMIVDNRPGANGKIGLTVGWKAKPDGYTLVAYGIPHPIMVEKLFAAEFRIKDFTHIHTWSINAAAVFVNPQTWKTFNEFLDAAKKKTMTASIYGLGGVSHIIGTSLSLQLGFPAKWVPYGGGGAVLAALAGNHVDFAVNFIPRAVPLVRAGKIRPLLVVADSHDFYPGIPIPKDLGYNIKVVKGIRGAAAPPNTPSDRIKILERAFAKAVREPEYIKWAKQSALTIHSLDSKQFKQATLDAYKIVDENLGRLLEDMGRKK
jgi:tripartite-type tricarboxylate transporter receptor subunit TctC